MRRERKMRKVYVYINGEAYEKGTEPTGGANGAGDMGYPTILPDIPDFISPIDGTVVHGRAGIREHCLKHNVVQTAELKGLPTRLRFTADNGERLEDIKRVMAQKGYL
jgi:hypothetical protein